MGRFLLSQLAHRRWRTVSLGVGVLVAAASFTMLTSAARTSDLRVAGTVSENFRPAYDVLVRPGDSFTPIERSQGLIQENYLSGIFGGITLQQYKEIRGIPGVQVAAPIANIGYIMPFQFLPVTINEFLSEEPVQLYRLDFEWAANNGVSHYPDAPWFVYFTREHPFKAAPEVPGGIQEVVGKEGPIPVCSGFNASSPPDSGNPFDFEASSGLACFSALTPGVQGGATDYGALPAGTVGVVVPVNFPMFLAAIDPVQEQRLLGIGGTLVSGRMLRPDDGPQIEPKGNGVSYRVVPLLASSRTYVDELLDVSVVRLHTPAEATPNRELASEDHAYEFITHLAGDTVGRVNISIDGIYDRLIAGMQLSSRRLEISYAHYWTGSPVRYRSIGDDRLQPTTTRNPPYATYSGYYGTGWAPWENRDIQFRRLSRHAGSNQLINGVQGTPALRVVGEFDPELLPGFSPLSQVPLETYYPPTVEPADPASREALGGRRLLPTMNLGGYVSQPPLMLTTLRGLRAFTNPNSFQGATPEAPISVIRVRVAGVTGVDELSRERIKNVAQAIHERTGLALDITAGSSPHPLLIELPEGKFGQPPLLVREGWVEKGVAVRFLDALDRKSLALFALILVICGFFLANGTLASVRSRRAEIGTLVCLGWSQGKVFRAVLGEVVLLGLVAGAAGTALAAAIVPLASLDMPVLRTLLVVPVAVLLATLAGIVPAWRAARSNPLDAIRPAVSERGSGRSVHRIMWMALSNLRRVPSRTMLAAVGLFIGVASLTLLLAINRSFQGVLVGTLLGNFVSVQVRGVDFLTVALTIVLGGLSVADVLFLNLRERAPELVTLRTVGWRDAHVRCLVVTEGVAMGSLGCLAGIGGGIAVASLIRGIPISSIAFAAGVAGAAGVVVASLASLVPLATIQRLTPPALLAEE